MNFKAPKEDPAVVAARNAEADRAQNAYIANTQDLLQEETRKRVRRLGARVALSGVQPSSFSGRTSAGVSLTGSGGGSADQFSGYAPPVGTNLGAFPYYSY